jgi:HEAT repeat protein
MRNLLILSVVGVVGLLPRAAAAQDPPPAGNTKEVLARLLQDLKQTGDVERRVQAAMHLADYGPMAEPALPALVAALADLNEDLRLNAAIAVGKIGKAAIPPLRDLLDGGDKDTRFYAIWALGWVGPDASEAAPALVKAMADKDAGIRRKAAYALGRIAASPQKTIAVLLAAFKDDNEDVRQTASDAVARFGIEAVPGLLRALDDSNEKVRLQAAHAIAEMGSDARDTVPRLRELLLAKGTENHAHIYAHALAKLGKAGVPALIDGFKDDRQQVRHACSSNLGQVGAEAVPALVDALGDKNTEVRRLAAQVLGPMRVADKMVVTALAYAIKNDEDDQVRLQCVNGLSYLGVSGKLGAPALKHALADPNEQVRHQAFYALQSMGENPRDGFLKALDSKDDRIRINTAALMLQVNVEPDTAVPVLMTALKHDKDEVRMQAAHALAQARRETGQLLPFFKEGLKSKTQRVRLQALHGIALIGPQANPAVADVIETLKDTDESVRQQAVHTLQQIPAKPDTVLPALTTLFKQDTRAVRTTIVQNVWRYGPKAMPLLLEAFKDKDVSIRQQAVWAMQNVGGDLSAYHAEISTLVKDGDSNVRLNVIQLLSRCGEKGAIQLGALLRDPDEHIRFHAASALQNAGSHVRKVLPALAEAIHDKNPNVRHHATYALAQAGEEGRKVLLARYEEAKEPQARMQILQALVYSPPRPQGIKLVTQALKDPDPTVRQHAVNLLAVFGQTQEVYDGLAAAIKDKDLNVRIAAAHGMQNLGPKGMPLLEQGLASATEMQLRLALLQGLINGNHHRKTMVAPLIEYLKDGQPQVRWQAAQLLGNIGADAHDAVPMLRELLNDTNPTVRQQAQFALSRIEPPKK